jgi:hypothetical protein
MILQNISELTVVGVHERGIPNQERIVILVNQPVNLGQYGLMIAIKGSPGEGFPIKDNLLWFGNGMVSEGDWLFVYTGPGQAKASDIPNAQSKLYSIHWGRTTTILQDKELVPILFRMDAVQVLIESSNLLPSET